MSLLVIKALFCAFTLWGIFEDLNLRGLLQIILQKQSLCLSISNYVTRMFNYLQKLFSCIFNSCNLALRMLTYFKGLFTSFEYITFFVSQQKKHFSSKFHLEKKLWLEIIEKIGCSKSVLQSTVLYIILAASPLASSGFAAIWVLYGFQNLFAL